MVTDQGIQRAIECGERNAAGFTMVKNWCAHVRIEKMGGGGLVEQMTGLPIGHHGLACDHASAEGMMCWEIRDAALDFYDRYCCKCALRQPVSLPNLINWVSERDATVARQQKEEEEETRETAAKLAERRAFRETLRLELDPIAADVIEQIEEMDLHRTSELSAKLVETAKLAPEAFSPRVIEYVFSLLEAEEHWCDEAGLMVLAELNANPTRLARCAMACLAHGYAAHVAARVLLARLNVAEASLVSTILPTITQMAAPSRSLFGCQHMPEIEPLVRVTEAFPQQILATYEHLLDQGPTYVALVARGLTVLAHRASDLVVRFARELIGKLVRGQWMPGPGDYGGEYKDVAADLFDAITEIFLLAPETTDKLMQNFRLGASEAGETRIVSVYCRVLRTGRHIRDARPVSPADVLAFQRLLWEAPKASSDNILREIQGAIADEPYELIELAKGGVDALLGSAILIDEKITSLDAEKPTNTTMLDIMERGNHRALLATLRDNFVSWAAAGASASARPDAFLQVLEGLPEDRDGLAASMIRSLAAMIDTADDLNAVLPTLFTALVGTSVVRRGSAAEAVGEMSARQRKNAPDLLFEAFMTSLTDPYVYVHGSAVRALRSMQLPPRFDGELRWALWQLLLAHRGDEQRTDILLKCVDLLASRYLTEPERRGKAGAFLVKVLAELPSWRVSNDVLFFARHLAEAPGLIPFLIQKLNDPQTTDYGAEDVVEALHGLPGKVIFDNREELRAVFRAGAEDMPEAWVLEIIQILGRSLAWAEAEHLSAAALMAIPGTVRETPRRQLYELTHAAVAFESALARGDKESAQVAATRWRQLRAKRGEKNEKT